MVSGAEVKPPEPSAVVVADEPSRESVTVSFAKNPLPLTETALPGVLSVLVAVIAGLSDWTKNELLALKLLEAPTATIASGPGAAFAGIVTNAGPKSESPRAVELATGAFDMLPTEIFTCSPGVKFPPVTLTPVPGGPLNESNVTNAPLLVASSACAVLTLVPAIVTAAAASTAHKTP